jgi:hypothetical protein
MATTAKKETPTEEHVYTRMQVREAIKRSIDSTVKANSLASEPKGLEDKPIPNNTTYKVSDCVKAWGQKTGVIINIRWASNANVLVYTVQYPMETETLEQDFYETELEPSRCN